MFKSNPKSFLLRTPTIYDIKGMPSFQEREQILKLTMFSNPKYIVKGGNSKTNPYKIHYDTILAERREKYELLNNSFLWSPNYTPSHFKFLFLYPLALFLFFLFYLRNIAWPRRMLYLKKKYGLVFPELEEKGWLIDWVDEDDDDINLFEEKKFENWSLMDLEKAKKEGKKINNLWEEKKKVIHDNLQAKISEIYSKNI